eukprot:10678463-Alexandrium_andersonii.AAC.1
MRKATPVTLSCMSSPFAPTCAKQVSRCDFMPRLKCASNVPRSSTMGHFELSATAAVRARPTNCSWRWQKRGVKCAVRMVNVARLYWAKGRRGLERLR